MQLRTELDDILVRLQKERESLVKAIDLAPYGTLNSEKRYGIFRPVHRFKENGGVKRALLDENSDLTLELIRKDLNIRNLAYLDREIDRLKHVICHFSDYNEASEINRLKNKYPFADENSIARACNQADFYAWDNQPYPKGDYLSRERTHTTSRGLKVRSKSELLICEQIYDYKLHMHYEELIEINGLKAMPDFTILRGDGKVFYWEHLGMLSDSQYEQRQLNKIMKYFNMGIKLWDNLVLTYDDLDGNIDLRTIRATIETRLLV